MIGCSVVLLASPPEQTLHLYKDYDMGNPKSGTRVTIIVTSDRRTAHLKIGDDSLETVGSKEALVQQWHQLKASGRVSSGQAKWLLPAILTCKLRPMTERSAAEDRLFTRQVRRSRLHRAKGPVDGRIRGIEALDASSRQQPPRQRGHRRDQRVPASQP